jgi:3-deoxy-D-manno-octulosonate 8-phosphate phosphatase (KDO 8-P phosphatase)
MNFPEKLKTICAFVFDVDGVLSRNDISLSTDGEPMRTANIKDGYAMQLAVKKGYILAIITGAKTENIRVRYERLGLKDIYLSASHKMTYLNDFLQKHGLDAADVLYMGDDIPDYEVMSAVGAAACPSDAAEEIKAIAHYVSPIGGGKGCARDVIEQTLKAQGKWFDGQEAFGW